MHLLIPRQKSQTRDLNSALLERETIIELNRDLGMKQLPKRIRQLRVQKQISPILRRINAKHPNLTRHQLQFHHPKQYLRFFRQSSIQPLPNRSQLDNLLLRLHLRQSQISINLRLTIRHISIRNKSNQARQLKLSIGNFRQNLAP